MLRSYPEYRIKQGISKLWCGFWGNANASKEEVIQAARAAQADEFIRNIPDQYGSIIGQSGVNLSGGQKQRISGTEVYNS
ncbi:hypothetical protein [Desulfosporosinus sp. BG]|uniref:hypothetical protein n=1 Tax=Desulfosporosinus sp. BG TaxID=1633135 RepID=UPI000855846E|nr:hypothetical protein [Desulfosporosinus sp. BG]ODA38895.1 Multidrug resistance ABC transporter ATP-binding and permease protein [Desulfosporosinus sp. BG]